MRSLKALRVVQSMKLHYASSSLSSLAKWLFKVINAHMNQLEELGISFTLPGYYPGEDSRSGWGPLKSTGVTNALIYQTTDINGCFPALQTLSIKSTSRLFDTREGEPVGLYCLLHYRYPALRELTLDFEGTGIFLNKLAKEHVRLTSFHWRAASSSGTQEDRLALMDFLESFDSLETCSLAVTDREGEDFQLIMAALIARHGQTFVCLRVLPAPCDGLTMNEIPFIGSILKEFLTSFPPLRQLEMPFQHPRDSEIVPVVNKMVRLKIVGLHPTRTIGPRFEIVTDRAIDRNNFISPRIPYKYLHEFATSLLSRESHLQEIFVYSAPIYYHLSSFPRGIPVYTLSKDH